MNRKLIITGLWMLVYGTQLGLIVGSIALIIMYPFSDHTIERAIDQVYVTLGKPIYTAFLAIFGAFSIAIITRMFGDKK